MSENAVLAALRRMGYAQGEMTGHSFRSPHPVWGNALDSQLSAPPATSPSPVPILAQVDTSRHF